MKQETEEYWKLEILSKVACNGFYLVPTSYIYEVPRTNHCRAVQNLLYEKRLLIEHGDFVKLVLNNETTKVYTEDSARESSTVSTPPAEEVSKHVSKRGGGQSRLYSLIESFANIAVGYGVAFGAQLLIFPIFSIQASLDDNLLIGALFTVVSLIRSYAFRRIFNWIGR